VSLINEALRKARQAASEHDSKQPEGAFRPAKAYPSRRSGRGGGLWATALIAVAAGVIGASAAWWILGDRETSSTEAVKSQSQPIEAASPAAPTAVSPTPSEVQANPGIIAVPTAAAAPPVVAPASERNTEELESPARGPMKPSIGPNGERIFVMEAELGYASLSLGFIVARTDDPFAEINGVEVSVGSEIEGFVVDAIEAERVVLSDDKGPLILRVP
jgi:hypothetical protein